MATPTSPSSDSDFERLNKETAGIDVEELAEAEAHLRNTTVQNITWRDVSVTVRDRVTKEPKLIVDNVEGAAEAGMYCLTVDSDGINR